ncbi:MAG: hypothetical protein ABIH46_02640 [Chloroflexota bacterium]
MLPEMSDKSADIESVARKALEDEELLAELIDGLMSNKETFRYNCFKVLLHISEQHGEVLYPMWDRFAALLSSDNAYRKLSGIPIIANLTGVDSENKFGEIFNAYYGLLDDKSMIVAIYAAADSGRIVRAKPELEARITKRLLAIDKTHHVPGRKALVKAGAIEAFDEYFDEAGDRDGIIRFVTEQLDSESPKTRKLARSFLQKWQK